MNINYEILNYYIYKKIIGKKKRDETLEDCARLNMTVEKYMLVKNYCTEVMALPALGEFYNLAYAELDMFDIKDTIADNYNLAFLKKIKMVPLQKTKDNVLLMAIGRPLDYNSLSMASTFHDGRIEYIFVPPTQIDILLDSITAVRSTSSALQTLRTESDKQLLRDAKDNGVTTIESVDDIINAPAVRLVD